MFLLKKIFQLRDHANSDNEKPFLEHLEDLRFTITRMVLTLAISMGVCFTFQDELMLILLKPINEVWHTHLQSQLPEGKKAAKELTVEKWEEAKKVDRTAASLNPEGRAYLYQKLNNPEIVFHADSVAQLRGVLLLPESKRPDYLAGLPVSAEMRQQLGALLESKANPESELAGNSQRLSSLKPTETFMLSMKLAFFAGMVVAFPLLMYYLLQFILPGLHNHEKKVMWPALAVGFGLFLGGVFFAYFVVLPRALVFFFEWGSKMGISNDWRIGEYISFATQFTLLFGVSFELPVVVMVLVKLGLLGYEGMRKTRSYAIVAIFIIAAVLTPTPDIFTQCLMAGPMIILYEACIWLAWWDGKKQKKQEEAEARERMERLLLDPHSTEEGEDHHGVTVDVDSEHHDAHAEDPYHQVRAETAGAHDEPPLEYDENLLPGTREEPRSDFHHDPASGPDEPQPPTIREKPRKED